MPSAVDLRAKLAQAAKVRERGERHIAVAAVITEAFEGQGAAPVVVGGAAVEFYTHGGYTTDDLDLVAQGGPQLKETMRSLGFREKGKDFVEETLGLYVEFPGRELGPSERTATVVVRGREVAIVSREDLIVDRLRAFKFWLSALDGVSALLLLESASLDEERLAGRAREEKVDDALAAIREVADEAIRQKLSKKRANALLERTMRALAR